MNLNAKTCVKTFTSKIIAGMSDMFMPIMNILCASGIMKGVLMLLASASIITDTDETYLILNAISDSAFYFLPVLLAFTSAKTFHTNPFYSAVIALVLMYPTLAKYFDQGMDLHFFTLPVKAVTYHSSIIPIIMASALLFVLERFLNKVLPKLLKGFLTPFLCLIIVSLITLFIFGPIGVIIGDCLANSYDFLYLISPAVAGLLLGAFIQPMVIIGVQWGFTLLIMNNISVLGYDTILPILAPSVFAQTGAALAVMLKSKDKPFRAQCVPAITSGLFGITEPIVFQINLPRKKPFLFGCIGGAIGGMLVGISHTVTPAVVFCSIITLPVFYGEQFVLFLIACASAFVIGFVLTMIGTKKETI